MFRAMPRQVLSPCAWWWRRLGRAGALAALLVLITGATAPALGADVGGRPKPEALTVDGLVAPIGLATTDVQFGWHVGDPRRGAVQSAYRLIVSRLVVG